MKNLACAVVFLFPFTVCAEENKNLLPSEEELRILRNCCIETKKNDESSIIGELKSHDPLRQLMRKRRLQLYAFEPDRPELGRLLFERHQKMYGFWYRQEYGILDK